MSKNMVVTMEGGRKINYVGWMLNMGIGITSLILFYKNANPDLLSSEAPVVPGTPEYESLDAVANDYLACNTEEWFTGSKLIGIEKEWLILTMC